MNKNKGTQIIVLGAGYAGMMAALRLAGKTRHLDVQVRLVNIAPDFVQRPRLHHLAVGRDVPQVPIAHMLRGTRVEFLQGWVSGIDLEARKVELQSESASTTLEYDYLIYALGSQVDQTRLPGIRQHAYVLDPNGPNGTAALREKLISLDDGQRVLVVGGGATGIEAAAEIKGYRPALQVTLLTAGRFGAFKGPRVERHIRQSFQQQDITVIEDSTVGAVYADSIELDTGERIPADLTLWAGGFRAPALAERSGFKVNRLGQVVVDCYGRSLSQPNIYAVGDASHPLEEPGNPVRMSLFTALIRGAHAADNLAATLKGKPQEPLSFAYYGQGIAMGPHDAVGFFGYPADQPVGPILRGKLAVYVRDIFVWMIFAFLVIERRFPGFFFWLGKNRFKKFAAEAPTQKAPEPSL